MKQSDKNVVLKRLGCVCAALLANASFAQAPTPQPEPRQARQPNMASQRYEINQTFDGRAYFKDNNVWVYTKEFADLFGMPAKYIEEVRGIAAAAFRIEDTSYQECGFGGQVTACRKVHQCLIDIYFDESKTPLPWASEVKSQWLPWYSSMRWLRALSKGEKRYGMISPESPAGVVRNETFPSPIIAFADPLSKLEATFTSNLSASGDDEAISGSMAIIGFTRDFYRTLSVVNLQFGCTTSMRKVINIRLDAKSGGPFEPPVARFNRIVLPEGFVQRIREIQQAASDNSSIFYRSLFPPPLGTRGASGSESRTIKP
jgi:hypothetical protein